MSDARSDAELAKELESLSLQLVERLDRKADLTKDDQSPQTKSSSWPATSTPF